VSERPRLVELHLAARPEKWAAAGFAVSGDGRVRVGTTDLLLGGGQGGITGWTLDGAIPAEDGIDGLATTVGPPASERPAPPHPNGVAAIDHIVVATPDTARTFEAFEAAGFELRRVRDAGTPERALRQGFLLLAEALVEVVGPPEPEAGAAAHAPARFWGLTFVAHDLEAAARTMGPMLGERRDAVQPGRRIATVAREAELGVPVALMTPRAETA
jgi:hypothetical protein